MGPLGKPVLDITGVFLKKKKNLKKKQTLALKHCVLWVVNIQGKIHMTYC